MRFDDAFPDLYRLAYRVSFRLLGDRGDAEDAAQEALARSHVHWARLHDHPEGWVVRVATNLAIDRLRRRRHPPTAGVEHVALVDVHLPERVDLARALRRLSRRRARGGRPALSRRLARAGRGPGARMLGGFGEGARLSRSGHVA